MKNKNFIKNFLSICLSPTAHATGLVLLLILAVSGCGTSPISQANAGAMDGAQGPSGVVKVLDFEADWTSQPNNNNLPTSGIFPTQCRTEEYLAGPNEVAIFNISGTASSGNTGQNNFLQLKAAMSENGQPFATVSTLNEIDSLVDQVGHVSTTQRIDLTEGNTYVFGAQFSVGSAITMSFSTCHGTVLIARVEP
jgi:hypothetical protein